MSSLSQNSFSIITKWAMTYLVRLSPLLVKILKKKLLGRVIVRQKIKKMTSFRFSRPTKR
jgi:hypothetical protein